METDYLIVGGGIAGLSAGIALKNLNKTFVVAESTPEARPAGAGITLAANAMEAYAELGVEDLVRNAGRVLRKVAIEDQKGNALNRVDLRKMSKSRYNLGIHRAALHQALLQAVGVENVLWNKRSKSLKETQAGYTVEFEDGTQIKTKYLIVAEGIHSKLRTYFLPNSEIRYAGYTCWRGIAQTKTQLESSEEAVEIWGSQGRFGYVRVNDEQVYWFATAKFPQQSKEAAAFTLSDIKQRFSVYPKMVRELLAQTSEKSLLWNDIIDLKPIPQFAFGKAVLIGDAAHATTPNMGQGACQAIEDALELQRCLQLNGTVEKQFSEFEKRRKDRSQLIVKRSWSLGKLAESTSPLVVALRNTVLKLVPEKMNLKQMEQILNQPRF